MDEADRFVALVTGRAVTADQVDAAVRLRGRLRALRDEVEQTVPGLAPRAAGGWRSTAADRYAERLDELQALFVEVQAAFGAAEVQLDERIRRLRDQLDAQLAALTEEARRG
ncbi:hypothetical protein LQ757_01325 [Agromyces sp. SYSU K20354]|uniref:hypothetical protein n=1 Tax=Agromyces cavernae TaxID=2898659 RepID=UPI001E2F2E22|nr:hypothetical protein [Agromyces cavernae]MCD2440905.1 hypothetical protein [Agromyces cavernae]